MAYYGKDEGAVGGEVVAELRLSCGEERGDNANNGDYKRSCEAGNDDKNGEYEKLRRSSDDFDTEGEALIPVENEEEEEEEEKGEPSSTRRSRRKCGIGSIWFWARVIVLCIFLGALAFVCIKWVGPFLMEKEVVPIIHWETSTFSRLVLAGWVFTSIALFPSILLPSSPSMWLAGIAFGYGIGFLLIISAAFVGVSLPYCIGSLFYNKIKGWLEKYPKRASILRLAGEGTWSHQFRGVALIRISPFPYLVYNYCAVATNVRYGPFICGSLVGMVPEIFVTMYTGILVKTLAEASNKERSLSATQILVTIFGSVIAVGTTAFLTVYAKRQLTELQKEDEQLLH